MASLPVPSKRKIELTTTGGVGTNNKTHLPLCERQRPAWTFSPTGATTRLVTGVTAATISGSRPFPSSAITPTTRDGDGLDEPPQHAAERRGRGKVVKVGVAFAIKPNKNTMTNDPAATVSLSDSVLLRFSPASTVVGESLLPCV